MHAKNSGGGDRGMTGDSEDLSRGEEREESERRINTRTCQSYFCSGIV